MLKRIFDRQAPTRLSRSADSRFEGERGSPHAGTRSNIDNVANNHHRMVFM